MPFSGLAGPYWTFALPSFSRPVSNSRLSCTVQEKKSVRALEELMERSVDRIGSPEREQRCYRPAWEIEQAALTLDLHTLWLLQQCVLVHGAGGITTVGVTLFLGQAVFRESRGDAVLYVYCLTTSEIKLSQCHVVDHKSRMNCLQM